MFQQGKTVGIGYVIVSNRVMVDKMPVGYLYREPPDEAGDSGWRIFAGDETQEYSDVAEHFMLYSASTILEIEPKLFDVLMHGHPCAFERSPSGDFVKTDDWMDTERMH